MDFGASHFRYILATRISLNGIQILDEAGNVATAEEIGTYSRESTDRKGNVQNWEQKAEGKGEEMKSREE